MAGLTGPEGIQSVCTYVCLFHGVAVAIMNKYGVSRRQAHADIVLALAFAPLASKSTELLVGKKTET